MSNNYLNSVNLCNNFVNISTILPSHILTYVGTFLDPKSAVRSFRANLLNKEEENILWKDLFQNHFSKIYGKETVLKINPSDKKTYKVLYEEKYKLLLTELPILQNNQRQQLLLKNNLPTLLSGNDMIINYGKNETFFSNIVIEYFDYLLSLDEKEWNELSKTNDYYLKHNLEDNTPVLQKFIISCPEFLFDFLIKRIFSFDIKKNLNVENLTCAFFKSAMFAKIKHMNLILSEFPDFAKKVKVQGKFGLDKAFCEAAKSGKTEVMKFIISNFLVFSEEISMNEPFGIGYAFLGATKNGKTEAMELILKKFPEFSNQITGDYSLAHAFSEGIKSGMTESLILIMNIPMFIKEIPIKGFYGLGYAFVIAVESEKNEYMELIMTIGKFMKKITFEKEYGLGRAFIEATEKGDTKAMNLICEKFTEFRIEISGKYGLGHAFCIATRFGKIEVMEWIIKKFPEFIKNIQVQEEYGLGCAFFWAAATGNTEGMKLIMAIPRFLDDINTEGQYGLGHAFCGASMDGKIESLVLIMKIPRFSKEIQIQGMHGLGDAYYDAKNNSHEKIVKLIKDLARTKKHYFPFNQIDIFSFRLFLDMYFYGIF